MKTLGRMAAAILLYIACFDIAGVVACLVLDVAPIRGKSSLAFYAVWLVFGGLCGFFGFNALATIASGPGEADWSNRPDAKRAGWKAIAVSSALIAGIAVASYAYMWRSPSGDSYFVPDSPAATITFLGAMLVAIFVANLALLPTQAATDLKQK